MIDYPIIKLPKPKDRAAWLEMRKPFVGASEAACLLGIHDHLSIGRFAVRKLQGIDLPETKAMRRGLYLEDGVAHLWEDEHAVTIIPCQHVYTRGPLFSTPDFVGFDSNVTLEVKTTAHYVTAPFDMWKVQCYVQAYCAGWTEIHMAVLDATQQVKSFVVDCTTDEAKLCIEQVVKAAELFLSYVEDKQIPEGLLLDEWAVKALFPRAVRRVVPIDAKVLSTVYELAEARQLKAAAEKREKDAKNELAGLMTDADELEYDGQAVLTWRNNDGVRESFDMAAFRSDNPDLHAKYVKQFPGNRVMRVTKIGKEVAAAMPWAVNEEEDDAEQAW